MATKQCTVCLHPKRHEIETSVANGVAIRRTARDAGLIETSLRRHLANCGTRARAALATAEARALNRDLISGIGLAEATYELHERTLAILSDAEKTKDLRTALAAIREARENLSQLGDWNGKTKGTTVNVLNLTQHPDYARLAQIYEAFTRMNPEGGAQLAALMRESAAVDVKAIGGGRR